MRLLNSEYKNVPPVEVELVVIANLIIIPSDVTMMVWDSFTYKIMQASNKLPQEPKHFHYLNSFKITEM